ncbi:hypothetical protein J3R73_001571 [Labrys monachus]|uniref:Uncharacterized protein n=1 Tax=Labrys monachus TaxID=217067 RepID=A0ABU0FAY2_9HYPH|nr:hypothetical protein [Labrys monachus]
MCKGRSGRRRLVSCQPWCCVSVVVRNRGLACCARPPSPLSRRAGRANRQRTGARLFPVAPDQACGLNRIAGREASPAPEGTVPSLASHAGQAPRPSPLPGQGSRSGRAKPHPRNGRDRGLGGRLMSSPHPAGRAAGSPCCCGRGRCGPGLPAAGVRQGDPAWKAPLFILSDDLRAAGASPVSRGICGRPEGGPIPARSSSSPVCRPDGRVIAHPALPDVGGPGIARESNGAVCSDPPRRRPRPGFQARTKMGGRLDAAGAPQANRDRPEWVEGTGRYREPWPRRASFRGKVGHGGGRMSRFVRVLFRLAGCGNSLPEARAI